MALWTFNPTQSHDVYTVVYLLKDALRSALSDAWFFERTAFPKADVKGADHPEIAARLGRFRDSCKSFQEREALMLTKLLRARTWAVELRKLAPEIQPEIDQFIDATEACDEMQADFLKDAQRIFNGGRSLARFLSQRKPDVDKPFEEQSKADTTDGAYLVGGRIALFELRAACEVFLGQINDEFFSSGQEETSSLTAPLMSYLEGPEEPSPAQTAEPIH